MNGNLVGKLVVCVTNPDGATSFVGQADGYYDQPTYVVDGKAWAASLTREATLEEQVAYWKAKATAHAPPRLLPQPPVSWDPDK